MSQSTFSFFHLEPLLNLPTLTGHLNQRFQRGLLPWGKDHIIGSFIRFFPVPSYQQMLAANEIEESALSRTNALPYFLRPLKPNARLYSVMR